jgi:hypothetical protein
MKKDFLYLLSAVLILFVIFTIGMVSLGFYLKNRYEPFFDQFDVDYVKNEIAKEIEETLETPSQKYEREYRDNTYKNKINNTIKLKTSVNTNIKISITTPNYVLNTDTIPPDYTNRYIDDYRDPEDAVNCYVYKIDEEEIKFNECVPIDDWSKISQAYFKYKSTKGSYEAYDKNRDKYCKIDSEGTLCEYWEEKADEKALELENEKTNLESLLDNYE